MHSTHQQAVKRLTARYLKASPEGHQFVREVEKALDLLKDAVDVAELRSSDNPETGSALTDVDSNVAHGVQVIREFSNKISPLLRRIR